MAFERLFASLRASGFSGPVVVERVDGTETAPMDPEQIDQRIERARIRLEGMLSAAGWSIE
ncbi:hypothetical protein N6H14_26050 [Paenibacillus sp. CC-CFT747]|nr:hypothetical protein N6H14_26050 [Paenibacillus sp. CC-CFT747]